MFTAVPVISEFLASNDSVLIDEDGGSSDWIELYNAGDTALDLNGWHLTDDATDLDQWAFPDVSLAPGGYLVVFASGKNRSDADGTELHTSFSLKASGEYLALVEPDGVTIADDYAPAYPPQSTDVSFGLSMSATQTTVLDETTPLRYHVPTSGALGTSWTLPGFNDAAWSVGSSGIGYENRPGDATNFTSLLSTSVPSGTVGLYTRFEFNVADPDAVNILGLRMLFDDGFSAYLNGVPVEQDFSPASPVWNSLSDGFRTDDVVVGDFAEYDISDHLDALVAGTNVLAIHVMNHSGTSTDMLLSPEVFVGNSEIATPEFAGFFPSPTPGAHNGQAFSGSVGDTAFSHDRGIYSAAFDVVISTPTAGASIVYTTDGSLPEVDSGLNILNGSLYTGPVPISDTTMLRAAAYKLGFEPTNVDTQTYVFLEDVLTQDPLNDPNAPSYATTWQAGVAGDFEIDPAVVAQWDDNNPANTDFGIREALTSIPTMSIVMDHDDLWHPSTGIYVDATREGPSWRRPGSIEYFDPNTGEQFQFNVGVQMHGNASRDNVRLLKHSFRLVFKDEFNGPGELPYALFDDYPVDEFNTLVLRASFTDSFATRTATGRYSPLDSLYFRDQWVRDTQRAMGHPASQGNFVHLYINGLYWGLYNPSERVDDAYLAELLGGQREDWDVLKDFNELSRGNRDAWNALFALARSMPSASDADAVFQRIMGNNPDGSDNPAFTSYLDMDNFADYMLLHFYSGVEDWPHHNWVAGFNRVDPGDGFRFFTWDQGLSWDGRYRDRTNVANSNGPGELYNLLRNSDAFNLHFADRAQLHLFNGGALSVAESRARWTQIADGIEAAIIGESARWGDARAGQVVRVDSGGPLVTIPTMTVDHWRTARDEVHNDYFPQSHALLISRLRSRGVFTDTNHDAPSFSQHGGTLPSGMLSITNAESSGLIYFTLDGSDPNLIGGGVSPSAIAYTGPITLADHATVTARLLRFGDWSAQVQADFVIADTQADDTNLRMTELHYNPVGATPAEIAAGFVDGDQFEFIELHNTSNQTISLDGVRLVQSGFDGTIEGIGFEFGLTALDPGERVVVVSDLAAFNERYGTGINVAGEYAGNLSNGGERVALVDANGSVIHAFAYADGDDLGEEAWPTSPDGDGPSLVVVDTEGNYDDGANWFASSTMNGTPGNAESPGIPADLDQDGDVDDADFGIAFAAFTGPNNGPSSNPAADLDNDGDVDDADFGIAFAAFTGPGGAAVLASAERPAESAVADAPDPLATVANTLEQRIALAAVGQNQIRTVIDLARQSLHQELDVAKNRPTLFEGNWD